jgi:hypothetical protein
MTMQLQDVSDLLVCVMYYTSHWLCDLLGVEYSAAMFDK